MNNKQILLQVVQKEQRRQEEGLVLIASENYCHPEIRNLAGSVLTNKYVEGYPGRRYYSGCQYIDDIELLAQDTFKKLFNAEHANVQPHSGSQANFAVYQALLQPGDTILGMNLSSGGHLTHGHNVNMSGKLYSTVFYGVNPETECIDMQEVRNLARTYKPKLLIAGASAYSRIIDFKGFAEIAKEVGAYLLADIAHIAGLVAAGEHPSPLPYADCVTFTTHKTFAGPRGGVILCREDLAKKVDAAVMPGTQGGAFANIIAAKTLAALYAQEETYKLYQKQVISNAKVLATALQNEGFRVVTDGTDNHLLLIDVSSFALTGKQAEQLLERVGIYCNRNTIPFDSKSPFITSGLRLGTPALTMRKATEKHMKAVAKLIAATLRHADLDVVQDQVALQVRELALSLSSPS